MPDKNNTIRQPNIKAHRFSVTATLTNFICEKECWCMIKMD